MSSTSSSSPPTITIPGQGCIKGTTITSSTTNATSNRYTGIPYALPPVGPRRFRRPEKLPSGFQYDVGADEPRGAGEAATSHHRTYQEFKPPCHQPTSLYDPLNLNQSDADANAQASEDCLYLNIWTPPTPSKSTEEATRDKGKWPILFVVHGGWLQVGTAYQSPTQDFTDLLALWQEQQCVVVCPAYRLNVFGFLSFDEGAGEGVQGNFGFWDQRAALEWTVSNAHHFNADATNVTIAGLSAGAQSAHAQVLHEFSRSQVDASYVPLIRRCLLRSGSAMVPSKYVHETKGQLDELCALLDVPQDATVHDKINALRDIPAQRLTQVIPYMNMHTFRSVKDGGPSAGARTSAGAGADSNQAHRGGFIGNDWTKGLLNGAFSTWARRHGITFIIGECANEDELYKIINPPRVPPVHSHPQASSAGAKAPKSLQEATMLQLNNYYPLRIIQKLLPAYEDQRPPDDDGGNTSAWAQYFGTITSDVQVFSAQRLLIDLLLGGGQGDATNNNDGTRLTRDDVLTYRLERRAAILDDTHPPSMGVFHGSDDVLFTYAASTLVSASDTVKAQKDLQVFREFLKPLKMWVQGCDQRTVASAWYGDDEGEENTHDRSLRRTMRKDGTIELAQDPLAHTKSHAVDALKAALHAEIQ